MKVRDALKVLGLPRDADERAVRRAYATLVKRHCPDVDPSGFARVHTAYERVMASLADYSSANVRIPVISQPIEIGSTEGSRVHRTRGERESAAREGVDALRQKLDAAERCLKTLDALRRRVTAAFDALERNEPRADQELLALVEAQLAHPASQSRTLRTRELIFLVNALIRAPHAPHALAARVAAELELIDSVPFGSEPIRRRGLRQHYRAMLERERLDTNWRATQMERPLAHVITRGAGCLELLGVLFDRERRWRLDYALDALDRLGPDGNSGIHLPTRERWNRLRVLSGR